MGDKNLSTKVEKIQDVTISGLVSWYKKNKGRVVDHAPKSVVANK